MQPVLIIQEVLSDLKLNFPVIPDLCNHARCREIICGWASQELRLGGETCLAWDQKCLQEIEKRRGEIISKYCQHQTLIPPNQHHRKKPPPVFFLFSHVNKTEWNDWDKKDQTEFAEDMEYVMLGRDGRFKDLFFTILISMPGGEKQRIPWESY